MPVMDIVTLKGAFKSVRVIGRGTRRRKACFELPD